MASKRRIRRIQCGGKTRYGAQDAAWAGLRQHLKRKKESWHMSPYPCRFCRGWHIGHTPKRKKTTHEASFRDFHSRPGLSGAFIIPPHTTF